MAMVFASASVWLIYEGGWEHWGLRRIPSELQWLLGGFVTLIPSILAVCLAIPGRCYGNRAMHKAGSVATGIALGLTIAALGLSVEAVTFGGIVNATFSDEQEAGVICAILLAVGMAVFLATCLIIGPSAYVLKKKVMPTRILVAVGALVTLLFLGVVAYDLFVP
jgi:hypothetical protein